MKYDALKILFIIPLLFIATFSFPQVKQVGRIGITVKDLDNAVRFYTEVLGFESINEREYTGAAYEALEGIFGLHTRVAILQLGDEQIELIDYLTSGGRTIPEVQHANDLFFQHIAIVVSDMDKAFAQLQKYNVEFVSTAPQTLPETIPPAAGVKAFYFHDPDNHNLELIYFPTGKGQPKWQNANGRIFLGIDHTAIGVSSTENSLRFYQGLLGIDKKGESFNFGTEQEHLNNVENASLHITGLRAAGGPGIEFLQYLKPGPGKLYPADTKANDLWFWQTTLLVDDAQKLFHTLKDNGYHFVSRELVQLHTQDDRYIKAFIVHDPDGHALLIEQDIN